MLRHGEQTLLAVQWRAIQQPVAGKVPGRSAISKQIGDEGLGAETRRPPPFLIKRRAGELVRRDHLSTVEDLAGRIAGDARQGPIGRSPVDKAAHDFRISPRRVHVHEPVCRIGNSEHALRAANRIANPVQDVRPEWRVERGIVNRPDKVHHLVLTRDSAARHRSTSRVYLRLFSKFWPTYPPYSNTDLCIMNDV